MHKYIFINLFLGAATGRVLTEAGVKKLRKSILTGGGFKLIKPEDPKEVGGALDDRFSFMVRILEEKDIPEGKAGEGGEERLGMIDGDHRKLLWLQL